MWLHASPKPIQGDTVQADRTRNPWTPPDAPPGFYVLCSHGLPIESLLGRFSWFDRSHYVYEVRPVGLEPDPYDPGGAKGWGRCQEAAVVALQWQPA